MVQSGISPLDSIAQFTRTSHRDERRAEHPWPEHYECPEGWPQSSVGLSLGVLQLHDEAKDSRVVRRYALKTEFELEVPVHERLVLRIDGENHASGVVA